MTDTMPTKRQEALVQAAYREIGTWVTHLDPVPMKVDTPEKLLKLYLAMRSVDDKFALLPLTNVVVQSNMADAEMNLIAQMHCSLVWAVEYIIKHGGVVDKGDDAGKFRVAEELVNSLMEK